MWGKVVSFSELRRSHQASGPPGESSIFLISLAMLFSSGHHPEKTARVQNVHRAQVPKHNFTRNSCAQLGAPTGSVPNPNHHRKALQLARCAHIRFHLCARIDIFLSCLQLRGSGSTTCRSFHQKYPRFFLRFDRFPERIYNARAVRGGADLHPVHRTA